MLVVNKVIARHAIVKHCYLSIRRSQKDHTSTGVYLAHECLPGTSNDSNIVTVMHVNCRKHFFADRIIQLRNNISLLQVDLEYRNVAVGSGLSHDTKISASWINLIASLNSVPLFMS